jgi:hypothetical protein
MASASTEQVLAATRQWLKPVIHILIRGGVTWRELCELIKSVYVEVATARFGKRGRPTNVSRTAVLTGLTRREVRKQRIRLAAAPEPLTGYVTKGCLVLAAWHLDRRFLDPAGKPVFLPMTGEGATFEALARTCGGDVRPTTLLKELVSAGVVRERPDGRLEALRRTYIPHSIDEQLIRLWGTVLADVATTYVHNLTRGPKTPARFERQAVSDRVKASALPEFQDFLNREGQEFLERLDAWLTEHEITDETGKPGADAIRLGVGVYHIQD